MRTVTEVKQDVENAGSWFIKEVEGNATERQYLNIVIVFITHHNVEVRALVDIVR